MEAIKKVNDKIRGRYYMETKVVAVDLNDCMQLCRNLCDVGFEWDGIIQQDGGLYWSFVKLNNDLMEEANEEI